MNKKNLKPSLKAAFLHDRISFLSSVAHQQYEAIESLNNVVEGLRRKVNMRGTLLQMILESSIKYRTKKK